MITINHFAKFLRGYVGVTSEYPSRYREIDSREGAREKENEIEINYFIVSMNSPLIEK